MEIKINVLEVASELAHADTLDFILDMNESHQGLFLSGLVGITTDEEMYDGENYKPEVQNIFNGRYDYYFEFLTNKAL